jgi:hypothetical protein
MKLPYMLLIIAALITGLSSCKKGNNESITGKWQQTKLRLYEFDDNNVIAYDTTYLAPFTNLDYVQFNMNGTCNLSSDHYYYPNDKEGYPTTPQAIPQSVGTLKYTRTNNKYVLSSASNLINPGGFDIRDTVSISGNMLLLRSTNYGHGGGHIYSISDSYYTR